MDMQIVRRGAPPPPWGDDVPYYWEGEEFVATTGGWIIGAIFGTNGSQSKQSDHLFLTCTGTSQTRTYVTANKISLANIASLKVFLEQTTADANKKYRVYVTNNADGTAGVSPPAVFETSQNGDVELNLNVSSLTGEYYLAVVQFHTSSASGTSSSKTFRFTGVKA